MPRPLITNLFFVKKIGTFSRKISNRCIKMAYSKDFKERLENIEKGASTALENINKYHDKIKGLFGEVNENSQDIRETLDQVNQTKQEFDEKVNSILEFLEENPDLSEEAQNLEAIIENIKGLQKQILVIYKQIYGFDNKDPNGQILNHEEGLKDKLEKSYYTVSNKIAQLEKDAKESYQKYLSEWEDNFKKLKLSIESLLPAATSAGLASAYNDKKMAEESSLRWGFGWFVAIICCMVVIGISLLLPQTAPGENDYIALFSRLVLFAPLIWIGIYQNKKINISKKIIEEYAHKASMMQTFNGLFIQMFKRGDNGEYISSDKVRETFLLQTLNTVNKNPAECISECNKSDNPMVDIVKLALKQSKKDASNGTFNDILKSIKDFFCSCEEPNQICKKEQNEENKECNC